MATQAPDVIIIFQSFSILFSNKYTYSGINSRLSIYPKEYYIIHICSKINPRTALYKGLKKGFKIDFTVHIYPKEC